MWHVFRTTLFIVLYLIFSQVYAAQDAPQTFTFDGRAFADSAASRPMLDTISTKVQILNAAQDCVLYEETQTVNTTATNGFFTIQVGSTTGSMKRSAGDSNNPMSTVFSNSALNTMVCKLISNGAGSTFTPSAGEKRFVRVQMTPASDNVTRTIAPYMALDSVPSAIVAERAENLQGLSPANLLQVKTTGANVLSQSNLENIFTNTNYTNLVNLLATPAANYVSTQTNGSIVVPSVAGAPGAGLAAGQIWYDSTGGVLKYYDGSVKTIGAGGGSGTVTSVSGSGPISVVNTTSTPVISITQVSGATSGFLGSSDYTTFANKLSSNLLSAYLFVGNGANTATGVQLSGDATLANTGVLTINNGVITNAKISDVNWSKVTGTPTTVSGYGITNAVTNLGSSAATNITAFLAGLDASLPAAGTAGRVYVATDLAKIYRDNGTTWDLVASNGAGGGGSVTSVTGSAPLIITNATSTPNITLTQAGLAASGYLSSNDFTTFNNKLSTLTPFSGDISGAYNTTSVDRIKGQNLTIAGLGSGNYLRYNGSAWVNADLVSSDITNALTFTPLNISLTSANIFVGNGANVATGVQLSGDATIANTGVLSLANTATARNNLGLGTASVFNVPVAGDAGAGEVVRGNDSRLIDGRAPIGAASGDLTGAYPNPTLTTTGVGPGTYTKVTVDTKGRVLAGTNISSSDLTTLGAFNNGGNSFGANASLGTNDNYDLNFKTNNATQMTLLANGYVGIGTTTPLSQVHVVNAAGLADVKVTSATGTVASFTATSTSGANTTLGSGVGGGWTGTNSNSDYLLISNSIEKMRITASGNVGIGTTTPGTRLHIDGGLALQATSTAPATKVSQGRIYFDSAANKFKVSENNGAYVDLVSTAAANSVLASAGTSSTPSISFSGDPDTGFYSQAANTIGVSAGGANIFNISSLGLISPTTGGASITTANGTSSTPNYSFAGDAGTGWYRAAASVMGASTGGVERMRIDSTGSVGIGTISPLATFHVGTGTPANTPAALNNGAYISGALEVGGTIYTPGGGFADFSGVGLVLRTTINSSIPTVSVKGKDSAGTIVSALDIASTWTNAAPGNTKARSIFNVYDTAAREAIRLEADGTTARVGIGGPVNSANLLAVNGQSYFSGNVGIGTSTPAATLDVNGSIQSYGFTLSGSNTSIYSSTGATPVPAGNYIYANNSASIDSTVAGLRLLATNGANNYQRSYIGVVSNAGAGVYAPSIVIGQQTGASTYAERFRIDANGNVGIGTTTPAYSLSVSGDVNVTGNFRVNGTIFNGTATSVLASSGTSSTPSISFSGDPDTGFYSQAANTIGVSAGGTNVFNISSLGLVSPTTGGASVTTANGTSSTPTYSFAGDAGTGWYRAAASVMGASTGGVERMRIDASGNVGIGTIAPSAKLEVSGDVSIGSPNATTPQWTIYGGASGTDMVRLVRTSGTNLTYGWSLAGGKMTFTNVTSAKSTFQTSYGAVIGGASEVNVGYDYGSTATNAGDPGLLKGSDSGTASSDMSGGDLYIASGRGVGAATPSNMYFQLPATTVSGTTRQLLSTKMTINNSGNVGIGSSFPGTRLEVNGDIGAYQDGNYSVISATTYGGSTFAPHIIGRRAQGTKAAPSYPLSGDVLLAVSGRDAIDTGVNSSLISMTATENFSGSAKGSKITLSTTSQGAAAPSLRMTIADNGNVGVGTSTPGYKLDVVGDVNVTGNFRMNGTILNGAATSVAAGAGTSSTPSISFSGDPDTGFYSQAANTIGVSAGGANVFNISSLGIVSPTTGGASITTANGTSSTPTYSFAGDAGTGWYRAAASVMGASTGGVERMRIDSSGNVGIGTIFPYRKFHVMSANGMQQTALFQSNYVGTETLLDGRLVSKNPTVQIVGGDDNENSPGLLTILSPNVGSSSARGPALNFSSTRSTTAQLAANSYNATQANDQLGNILFGGDTTTNLRTTGASITAAAESNWSATSAASLLYFSTAASGTVTPVERLRITSNGNVGIGTTTPGYSLSVSGDVNVSGNFRMNGVVLNGTATSVSASAGTSSTPSISFSGDPDTGFYSQAANTIGVSAGGANIFNISSLGLVSPTTGGALITTANGTSSTPTYSFAGDPGTGWYRAASSTMGASTGGVERMRIDASGNVGIGTTAPTHSLTLDSTSTGIVEYNTADQTVNYERVRKYWSGNIYTIGFEKGGAGVNRTIQLGGSLGQALALNQTAAAGAVQVSATSATLGSKSFTVSGTLNGSSGTQTGIELNSTIAQTGTAGYNALTINPTESTTGSGAKRLIAAQVGGVDKFTIDNAGVGYFAGNVGIGTASPGARLQINSDNSVAGQLILKSTNSSNSFPMFAFQDSTGNNLGLFDSYGRMYLNAGQLGSFGPSTVDAAFAATPRTNNTPAALLRGIASHTGSLLSIQNSSATETANIAASGSAYFAGNVGIGTTTPLNLLTLYGTSSTSAPLVSVSSGTVSAADSAYQSFNNRGFIGFNATNQALDLTASTSKHITFSTNNSGALYGTSERMRIDQYGNVGMGTTTPASKLQVNGAITNVVSTYSSAFTCASSVIDFTVGNFVRFAPSNVIGAGLCTVGLSNLVAGGSYNLVVTGNAATNAVTYSFTGYSFKYLPVNSATTAGQDTIYTFLYDGTTVYVTWSGGYQ